MTPRRSRSGTRALGLLRALAVIVAAPFLGRGHPLSMSSAVVDVYPDRMALELRVLVEDLVLYYDLEPEEDKTYSAEALRERAEAHKELIQKYFVIRDVEGDPIPFRFAGLDDSQIAAEGVASADLMTYAVVYQLAVSFDAAPPFLTFTQAFSEAKEGLPARMDVVVLQSGRLVDEPAVVTPRQPYTVEFDWDDPKPLPRGWRERKKLRDDRRKALLGITSYSSVYSYLYITRDEVRLELLMPLLTLETWLPIERANPDWLEVEEQTAAESRVRDFSRDTRRCRSTE